MKIVVTDGYALNPGDISWSEIEKLADDIEIYDRTDLEDWELGYSRIKDADVIVTNKYPITKKVMDHCPNLKAVAVTATGYNIIDTEYADQKGIAVMNVPTYGTAIVSQFTVGMLLDLCAKYEHHDQAVKEGRWEKNPDFCFWDSPIRELDGKTAGIIGLGKIGRATATVLKALGMKILAVNPSQCDEGRAVAEYVDLDTLLKQSDVILLHCPLFPDTKEIINKDTITEMKDDVIIINTSRGPLINEQDLADALNNGKVAAAAVDVVSTEPIQGNNPLLTAKNCIITPHIAWASVDARKRIMHTTAENIKSFIDGNPKNQVNHS